MDPFPPPSLHLFLPRISTLFRCYVLIQSFSPSVPPPVHLLHSSSYLYIVSLPRVDTSRFLLRSSVCFSLRPSVLLFLLSIQRFRSSYPSKDFPPAAPPFLGTIRPFHPRIYRSIPPCIPRILVFGFPIKLSLSCYNAKTRKAP